MTTEDLGSYFRILTVANCFFQATKRIYEADLRTKPRPEPMMVVPFVVNASFACELFLKTLAQREGVRLKGHELIELFAALPMHVRQQLHHEWVKVAGGEMLQDTETLESVPSELSNSFVEWRYTHEKERIEAPSSASIFHLLRVLADALVIRG
jgi:uncharacterized protein (DUF2267 family)